MICLLYYNCRSVFPDWDVCLLRVDIAISPWQACSPLIQLFFELASEYLIKQMHKEIKDRTWLSDFTPLFQIRHFVTIVIGIIIVKKKTSSSFDQLPLGVWDRHIFHRVFTEPEFQGPGWQNIWYGLAFWTNTISWCLWFSYPRGRGRGNLDKIQKNSTFSSGERP